MPSFKRTAAFLLRIGVSAALLWFLISRLDIDLTAVLKILRRANLALILPAFLIYCGAYLLGFYRWKMLLDAGGLSLPLSRVCRSFCGGVFFNLFMPSSIGGDMVRSIDLAAHTKKPSEVIATVFLDRLSGYVGLVLVMMAAAVFGIKFLEDRTVVFSLLFIVGALGLLLVLLFNRWVYRRLLILADLSGSRKVPGLLKKAAEAMRKLHHEIHIFRNRKAVLVKNVLVSVLIQITAPVVFYLCSLAIGENHSIVYFFIFIPIIGAITLLPISLGGLGLRDAAMVYFFAKVGMGQDAALALSLLNFLFIIICSSAGGVVYVFTLRNRRVQRDASSAGKPSCGCKG